MGIQNRNNCRTTEKQKVGVRNRVSPACPAWKRRRRPAEFPRRRKGLGRPTPSVHRAAVVAVEMRCGNWPNLLDADRRPYRTNSIRSDCSSTWPDQRLLSRRLSLPKNNTFTVTIVIEPAKTLNAN